MTLFYKFNKITIKYETIVDPEFPPQETSLVYSRRPPENIVWLRASVCI